MTLHYIPDNTSLSAQFNDPNNEFVIVSDGSHKHSGTFSYVIVTDISNDNPIIIATGTGIVNGLLSHMSS